MRMAEMCDRLGAILGRPSWLPVPEFALRALLGEGATVVSLILYQLFAVVVVLYDDLLLFNSGFTESHFDFISVIRRELLKPDKMDAQQLPHIPQSSACILGHHLTFILITSSNGIPKTVLITY